MRKLRTPPLTNETNAPLLPERAPARGSSECIRPPCNRPPAAQGPAPAASYTGFYGELREARPLEGESAPVSGLTLRRDGAEFILQEGRIWLLSPVSGRTVAAGFQGTGTFRYTPATVMEQERLNEVKKMSAMDERFSELIILFGDSTLDELRGKLTFGPGERNDDLRSQYREVLAYLGKDDKQSLDPDVAVSLLNGEQHRSLLRPHDAPGDPVDVHDQSP